ncbi:hypothetical protein SLA2020_162270 [Shorea laevis]
MKQRKHSELNFMQKLLKIQPQIRGYTIPASGYIPTNPSKIPTIPRNLAATDRASATQTQQSSTMADVETEVAAGQPKKRTFKKFSFRGVDLDALLDMSTDELVKLFHARARRRFQRGLKRKPMALIKKLRKAKREAPPGEKPEPVRTHLRNMIIVPEMIGSIIGVYNGKTFNQVEIKPEMIGHYLAEFSISYKPVKHGRPGIGATHSSRFIPLK